MADIEIADADSDKKTKAEIIQDAIRTRAAARSKAMSDRLQRDFENGLLPY
jgi:hypothetical protein